jgi:glycosyltransferase involved in cell wall biosynthesis
MFDSLPVKTNLNFSTHRVLIISDAAAHRNGVGAYYADLAEAFERSDVEIEVVSPEIIGGQWQGGWSLPLPGDKTQRVCLPNAFNLQKKIKSFDPTVIVIPTPGMFGLVGALLARRMGISVVVGFHTWFEKLSNLYWNKMQGGLTKTYFELSHKMLFKLADQVLANSEEMVSIALSNGAVSAELMGTPISQRLLSAPVHPAPKTVKRALFVGRLAAEKNIESIIVAAENNSDIEFTVAGDGPLKDELCLQAKGLNNVKFLGWVDREKVIKLIDSHDIFILPSKVESFGTVAMEAMARQRFVIVSESCGITQWEDLRKGLSIIPKNSTLSEEIKRVKSLSEFELYSRCIVARRVALDHVESNCQLWLSCFSKNRIESVDVTKFSVPIVKQTTRGL